jgi:hypothetical protein
MSYLRNSIYESIISSRRTKNMNQKPGRCPISSNELTVTRLQCGNCGTGIDGGFSLSRLQALTGEQVRFVEAFIKCKGKIKDVEEELGISYPTVVGRLNDVVRTMGYDVDESELSEVDKFEYYQAQVINPQMPPTAVRPYAPTAPSIPAPAVPAPPAGPLKPKVTEEQRRQILEDLNEGKISATEAMKKLYG